MNTKKKWSQKQRLAVALFTAALLLLVCGYGETFLLLIKMSDWKTTHDGQAHLTLESVLTGNTQGLYAETLPEAFEEELISLQNYSDIRVSPGGRVIGFSAAGDAFQVFDSLSRSLTSKGWVKVASGLDAAASFVKQEGQYTWMYLDCTAFDATSSVVVRLG